MNFEKRNNIYKGIMVIIVTAIITFILTAGAMYSIYFKDNVARISATQDGNVKLGSVEEMLSEMENIKKELQKDYIGEINEQDMLESAVKGYVEGLGDEYTEYFTKEEFKDFMIDVNGDYVGVGIYMTQDRDGNIIVLMPIEGSPAEEVGIKTGDIIVRVNDEECIGKELDLVANSIKGEEGSTAKLEILRDEETLEFEIVRREIEIKYINSKIIEGNIGYVQLLSFAEDSAKRFEEELGKLLQQDVKSLIIDVRDNGGGVVTDVINIADMLLDKGQTIMVEKNKKGNETEIKSSNNSKVDINMVILGNEYSASASEILIGALVDNKKATFVGTRTYGKGVMQELIEMPTGGALKITIEEFFTPNRNPINIVGIKPDIEVKLGKDEDTQLEKAIEILKNK